MSINHTAPKISYKRKQQSGSQSASGAKPSKADPDTDTDPDPDVLGCRSLNFHATWVPSRA